MRVDFFCLICNLSICIYIKQPKWDIYAFDFVHMVFFLEYLGKIFFTFQMLIIVFFGSFFIQFLGAVFLFREGTERVFLFKCILTGTKVLSRLSGKFRAGVRGCDQIVRAFQLGVFESVVGSFCGYTLCTTFQAFIQIVARLHLFREGIFSG